MDHPMTIWLFQREKSCCQVQGIVKAPKWEVKVKSLSRVWLFATPWTVAYHTPPSMGFSRQEYWSGLPFPSPVKAPTGVQMDFHTRKEGCIRAETLFPKISGATAQSHLKKCGNYLLALLGPLSCNVVHCPGLCPLYPEAGVVPVLLCCWSGPTGRRKQCPAQTGKKESQVSSHACSI